MNALFLQDLAQKTHRGLEGRVRQGKSGGGKAFGYDVVRKTDSAGEPIRGERQVNESEATDIRRIFEIFAQGAFTSVNRSHSQCGECNWPQGAILAGHHHSRPCDTSHRYPP